jgi:hypothetical protein
MLGGPFTEQHRSSSPQQRERARKYTLADQSAFVATRDLIALLLAQFTQPGWSAWKMNERGQRRVIVVVVGVTPHPGDGSAVTGQRITGNLVQSLVSIEVLDLMNDPLRELEHLSKLASADPTKRFSDLYRLVGHEKQKKSKTESYWRAGCSEELPAQF